MRMFRWLFVVAAATIVAGLPACSCSQDHAGADLGGGGGGGGSTAPDLAAGTGTGADMTGAGCGLRTCASEGAQCGPIGDGCGGVLQCGTCTAPQTCGGGGTPFVCGGTSGCVPRTCASAGANCGPLGDGCGALLQCGATCPTGQICGGAMPSVCGAPPVVDAGTTCTNLCLQQVACDGGSTTLSGTVVAGTDPTKGFGMPDPIYNALVYVPNGTVQPFAPGVSCDQCGAQASGSPLVSAVTGIDGKFQLQNVPCGMNIPLVIQLGRWRRQITIPSVACCASNTIASSMTRLPRNKTEGDIPHIAISTGDVDGLECVLRKMGIDDSEFTQPSGNGRVHVYQGNGATAGAGTPSDTQLYGNLNTLKNYDMVLFACYGSKIPKMLADQQRVIDYTNAGGRVFATHFSYVWLATTGMNGLPGNPAQPAPFVGTAMWHTDQGSTNSVTGIIDTTFPKGMALSQWLQGVGASTMAGKIPVNVVRWDLDGVVAPSQRWMSSQAPDPVRPVLHYTFNTPVGTPPAQQCGRVVFSDFHVEDASNNRTSQYSFPGECTPNSPMTPQEKLLEFMLFDLASCITPDTGPPGMCTPRTCQQIGANCGPQGDGCGGVIQCGDCMAPQTCGGGGMPGVCGAPMCTPRTCQQANANCGIIGDGCGGTVDCGTCTPPATCGGGGVANQCGGGVIP
jgi:hypothetical protein